jgi:dolichol-phosphate mannosyltransferase
VPIELLGYTATAMTTLSFFAVAHQIVDTLRHPEISHGISTIIAFIAFFGSVNLLAIAILGEYLIKIFEETKRRPKFVRRAIRHGGERFTTAAEIGSFLERRARDTARRSLNAPAFHGDEGR